MWSDLRLRLLAEVGHFPSHRVRNACYRASGMTLPESSSIHWRAEFYAPERIVVGEHVIIGDSAFLDGRSGLTIGNNVNLGSHVSIYTREHDVNSPTFAETGGPVTIGDRAWVSSHSVVLPGIAIGEGAVVAAGAIVTKDVRRTRSWAATRPSPSARATGTSPTSWLRQALRVGTPVRGEQQPGRGGRPDPSRDHSPLANG